MICRLRLRTVIVLHCPEEPKCLWHHILIAIAIFFFNSVQHPLNVVTYTSEWSYKTGVVIAATLPQVSNHSFQICSFGMNFLCKII